MKKLIKIKNNYLSFKIGREKDDPEKLLLPGIVFINTNHYSFEDKSKGFMIFIRWWNYSISFGLIIK